MMRQLFSTILLASLTMTAVNSCGKVGGAFFSSGISTSNNVPTPLPTPGEVTSDGALIPPVVVIGSYLTGVLLDSFGEPLQGIAVGSAHSATPIVTDEAGKFTLPALALESNRVQLTLNGSNLNATVSALLPEDIAIKVAAHRTSGTSNEPIDRLWVIQMLPTPSGSQSLAQPVVWSASLRNEAINPTLRKRDLSEFSLIRPLPGSFQGGEFEIAGQCKTGSVLSISGDLHLNAYLECLNGRFSANLSPDSPDGPKRIYIEQRENSTQYISVAFEVTKDTTAPSTLISPPNPLIATAQDAALFDVTFYDSASGISSIALPVSSIQLIKTGTADCSTIGVSGSETTKRRVSVSGCSGNGTVAIKVLAGAAIDHAGHISLEGISEQPLAIVSSPPGSAPVNLAPTVINLASQINFNSQLPFNVDFSIIDANSVSELSCTERLSITSSPANAFRISRLSQTGMSGSEMLCQATLEMADSLLANPPTSASLFFTATDSKGAASAPRETRLSLRDKWDTALLYRFDSNTLNLSHYTAANGWPSNIFSPPGSVAYTPRQNFGTSASVVNQGISLQSNLVHEIASKKATIELAVGFTQSTRTIPTWLVGKNGSWKVEVELDSSSNGRFEKVIFSVWNTSSWRAVLCSRGDFPESGGYTHIAATFNLGAVNLFVNGRKCGSGSVSQTQLTQNSNPIFFDSTLRVLVDELRISRTIRYIDSFTPPLSIHPLEAP